MKTKDIKDTAGWKSASDSDAIALALSLIVKLSENVMELEAEVSKLRANVKNLRVFVTEEIVDLKYPEV